MPDEVLMMGGFFALLVLILFALPLWLLYLQGDADRRRRQHDRGND